MWKRAIILLLGSVLLLVSGAEAINGHCAASASSPSAHVTMDHCAEMMDADHSNQSTPDKPDLEGSACCCTIMCAPVFLLGPALDAAAPHDLSWQLPVNIRAASSPEKVAIPPPKI